VVVVDEEDEDLSQVRRAYCRSKARDCERQEHDAEAARQARTQGGSSEQPSSTTPWPSVRPPVSRRRSAGPSAAAPLPSSGAMNVPSWLHERPSTGPIQAATAASRQGVVDIGAGVLAPIYFRFYANLFVTSCLSLLKC
jgi:hypothetical protein